MPGYDEGKFVIVNLNDPNTEEMSTVAVSTGTASVVFGPRALTLGAPFVQRPPDDHPIYGMVGRIASNWAHVERLLDQIIWELAEIEGDKGSCITSQLGSIPARCNVIIALLALFETNTKIETKRLIEKTERLRNSSNTAGDPRNRAVHDPWYHYTEVGKTAQFRAMPIKDLRYGLYPVDETELGRALGLIREFAERVSSLKTEISALLALQKKSSELPA